MYMGLVESLPESLFKDFDPVGKGGVHVTEEDEVVKLSPRPGLLQVEDFVPEIGGHTGDDKNQLGVRFGS